MREKIRSNYHWIIALLMLLEMTVYGGTVNNINSVFLLPVTESLEISRGSFSLSLSVRALMGFISTMISGALFLRFGYRKMSLVMLPLATVSLTVMSSSQNIVLLTLGAAMFGLCEGFCSTSGLSRLIGDWFHRHRGAVLGFVSAFTGVGGGLFCPMLTDCIEKSGWRNAYRLCAALFLVVGVLMLFFVRSRPDQMGLEPYGAGELPKKKRHGAVSEDHWPGFSLQELLRRPTFYMMIAGILLSCILIYLEFYVVVPHMQDCGFSADEAAAVQSAMLLIMAVAKLACGSLCDWIGPKWVTVICIAFGAVGTWLLTNVQTMTDALIAIALYSVCLPITTITVPLLTISLFGYRAHDTAVGIFLSMVSVASLIASPLCNLAYDAIGSYVPVFRVSAILSFAVIGLFALLYVVAARDRKAWTESWDQNKKAKAAKE